MLDLVLLAVIILFIVVGVHRGLVRSAVHFVGSIVASFLASALGGAIAQWVFDAMFREALVQRVSDSINSLGMGSVTASLQNLFSSLPDFIVRALEAAGVTVSLLEGVLAHGTGQAAELVADSLAPVFVGFLKVLAVIVLFFLFMMLVRILADMLGRMFYLPVLKQLNGLLGGLFGFLLALISLWIVISGIQVFLPMLTTDAQTDIEIALNHSLIAGLLVRLNPLSSMFS